MAASTSSANTHTIEMYREKHKTIRRAIFLTVILIVGILIVLFGGRLKVSRSGIEISKDVLQTTGQKKESGGNGEFTTGDLNDAGRKFIEDNKKAINPAGFTGKNYINNDLGYLFSVARPEKWTITYNPQNANQENAAVNAIDAGDGINFKVSVADNSEGYDIEEVAGSMYLAFSMLAEEDPSIMPGIQYDKASQTAFFNGANVQNHKRVLMKIVIKNRKGYFAYVEYPKEMESDDRVKSLREMVATLTAI
jgi:hypothetical protein